MSRFDYVRSTKNDRFLFLDWNSFHCLQLITSDEVLLFYEKGNLNDLIERMKSESERNDPNSLLNYHIELVHLLAMCTEGKNASTEIKCHSLIGLDDLVLIVTHPDCLPEVKSSSTFVFYSNEFRWVFFRSKMPTSRFLIIVTSILK